MSNLQTSISSAALPSYDTEDLRYVISHHKTLQNTSKNADIRRFCQAIGKIATVSIGKQLLEKIQKIEYKVFLSLDKANAWQVTKNSFKGSLQKRVHTLVSTPEGNVSEQIPLDVILFHEFCHLEHFKTNTAQTKAYLLTEPLLGEKEYTNLEEYRTIALENQYRQTQGYLQRAAHVDILGNFTLEMLSQKLHSPIRGNAGHEEGILHMCADKGLSYYFFKRIGSENYLRKSGLGASGFSEALPILFSSWNAFGTEKAKMLAASLKLLKTDPFFSFDQVIMLEDLWEGVFKFVYENKKQKELELILSPLNNKEKEQLYSLYMLKALVDSNRLTSFQQMVKTLRKNGVDPINWLNKPQTFVACMEKKEFRDFVRKSISLESFVGCYTSFLLSEHILYSNLSLFEHFISLMQGDEQFYTQLCGSDTLVQSVATHHSELAITHSKKMLEVLQKRIPHKILEGSVLSNALIKKSKESLSRQSISEKPLETNLVSAKIQTLQGPLQNQMLNLMLFFIMCLSFRAFIDYVR